MHTSLQILKIVGPLSKMKPCTWRGPEICTTISFQALFALLRIDESKLISIQFLSYFLYFYEVLSHEKSVNRRRGEHLRERAHRGGICVLHCAPEKDYPVHPPRYLFSSRRRTHRLSTPPLRGGGGGGGGWPPV